MVSRKFIALCVLLASYFVGMPAVAAPPAAKARTPFAAFRIAGNLYYVGTLEDASYLVSTPKGLILINTGFEESTPLIRKSVEDLGFKWTDIKILLSATPAAITTPARRRWSRRPAPPTR